ncbi:hypothetical protein G6011_02912 [Alternaria panax]|uniref:SHSP domain-containing protein n=1 Tax=Alternaria panax TaxID=48097 RepID=A0AAD4I795_9PLEO|nr:hypothetical protein G6011_02912 [Alternaria panax]
MAFVLTPRFAPAYQAQQCSPFGYCAPAPRPTHGYRVSRPQPRRPQYSAYNNFFSQVDELLSEIDREAQRQAQIEAHREALREAYRQRQLQRKRALRAEFQVNQVEQGWQIDGEIQGFSQDNINIEAVDEQTLKIAGNTHWQAEESQQQIQRQQAQIEAEPASALAADEQPAATPMQEEAEVETTTEADTTTTGVATPDTDSDSDSVSDTSSHKSYQPTVEDDFEDIANDFPNSRPASPTDAEPREPKGKEKAVEEHTCTELEAKTETAVVAQPQVEVPAVQQQQPQEQPGQQEQQERVHGSFERTFRFPERIDVNNVSASFKEGVLRVVVPRAQKVQGRRIAIL